MIISHEHEYVFIGIPRNASKSVSQWLAAHYHGEWHGAHHQWRTPEGTAGYLKFAVVRNPYERSASGSFGMHWGDETPAPEKQVPAEKPVSPTAPLEKRIEEAKLTGNATRLNEGTSVPEIGMNQTHWIRKAGISLALYFERLPECLGELPFVDPNDMPPLSRALEKGIRPPGSFFDHFTPEDEQVTWAFASEDFKMLGYRRYDAGLPQDSPSLLRV